MSDPSRKYVIPAPLYGSWAAKAMGFAVPPKACQIFGLIQEVFI